MQIINLLITIWKSLPWYTKALTMFFWATLIIAIYTGHITLWLTYYFYYLIITFCIGLYMGYREAQLATRD